MSKEFEVAFKLGAELTKSFKSAFKDADNAFKGIEAASKRMQDVGKSLSVSVTAPIVAVGTAAFASANEFQKAMGTIRTGTGATGEDLKALGDNMKNVLRAVPNSIDEVSSALADLNTRTGLVGKPLEDLTQQVLELGRVSGADTSALIEKTTRVFGDWGIETDKQSDTLDNLWKVSQTTGIGVDDLAQKVVQFGAPLRQMGFSLEESATLFGKWEKEGVNAELVAGSLRIALGNLARDGKEPAEEFPKIIEQIKSLSDEGQATAMAMELFGSRAGPDMAAAIREGRFEIDDLMATINGSSETISKASDETMTFSEKLAMIKNQTMIALEPLGSVLLNIADRILPYVSSGIEKVSNAFANLSPGVKTAMVVIGGIAAAIGPVLFAIGTMGNVVVSLFKNFMAFKKVFATLKIAAFAGPIGIAIGAIVALSAAFIYAWNHVDGFKEGVINAFNWIKDGIFQAIEVVKPYVMEGFSAISDFVMDILGRLKEFWDENGAQIIAIVMESLTKVYEVVTTLLTGVWDTFQAILPAILSIVEVVWESIKLAINNAIDLVTGIINTALALIRGDWEGAWNSIKATAETIMDNIIGFFQSIDLVQTGKDIINGLINGIKSMGSSVLSAIASLIPDPLKNVASGVMESLGINGYATGGIVSRPELAMIGEGGDTEAVIPWNNSKRAFDLWALTGQKIGAFNNVGSGEQTNPLAVNRSYSTSRSQSTITLQSSPTIIIQSSDVSSGEVERQVTNANKSTIDEFKEWQHNEGRLAF